MMKLLRIVRNILAAMMIGLHIGMTGDQASDDKDQPDQEIPE